MPEKQENTIVYRMMKSQNNYFPDKTFIDIVIEFNRSFVLWQIPLKVAGSIYRIAKCQKSFFLEKI